MRSRPPARSLDRVVTRVPRRGSPAPSRREVDRVAEFRTQLRRFLLRTEAVTSGSNLTPQRYDLLLMIKAADRDGNGVRLTDLCDRLQMKQTAVTELVKRTEQAGLIGRHRSPDDGRVSLLRLTAEGERRLVGVFEALRDDRQSLAESFAELAELFRLADR